VTGRQLARRCAKDHQARALANCEWLIRAIRWLSSAPSAEMEQEMRKAKKMGKTSNSLLQFAHKFRTINADRRKYSCCLAQRENYRQVGP
jgi:hypothetical protein